jgi:hypothetical protein
MADQDLSFSSQTLNPGLQSGHITVAGGFLNPCGDG